MSVALYGAEETKVEKTVDSTAVDANDSTAVEDDLLSATEGEDDLLETAEEDSASIADMSDEERRRKYPISSLMQL